ELGQRREVGDGRIAALAEHLVAGRVDRVGGGPRAPRALEDRPVHAVAVGGADDRDGARLEERAESTAEPVGRMGGRGRRGHGGELNVAPRAEGGTRLVTSRASLERWLEAKAPSA